MKNLIKSEEKRILLKPLSKLPPKKHLISALKNYSMPFPKQRISHYTD